MIERDLEDFISGSIPSVWALELLLLLRTHPDRTWTQAGLVQELRASETVVRDALATFETSGLVRADEDEFAYQPASPALAELSDALAELYRQRPVALVNAITRSKKSSLQSFADAFRLKDPPR